MNITIENIADLAGLTVNGKRYVPEAKKTRWFVPKDNSNVIVVEHNGEYPVYHQRHDAAVRGLCSLESFVRTYREIPESEARAMLEAAKKPAKPEPTVGERVAERLFYILRDTQHPFGNQIFLRDERHFASGIAFIRAEDKCHISVEDRLNQVRVVVAIVIDEQRADAVREERERIAGIIAKLPKRCRCDYDLTCIDVEKAIGV